VAVACSALQAKGPQAVNSCPANHTVKHLPGWRQGLSHHTSCCPVSWSAALQCNRYANPEEGCGSQHTGHIAAELLVLKTTAQTMNPKQGSVTLKVACGMPPTTLGVHRGPFNIMHAALSLACMEEAIHEQTCASQTPRGACHAPKHTPCHAHALSMACKP
jgi:hypothetical protein